MNDFIGWWLGLKLSLKFCAVPLILKFKDFLIRLLVVIGICGVLYYSFEDMREGWRDERERVESVCLTTQ